LKIFEVEPSGMNQAEEDSSKPEPMVIELYNAIEEIGHTYSHFERMFPFLAL